MRLLFVIFFAGSLLTGQGQVVSSKQRIDGQIDPMKWLPFQQIDSAKNGSNQKLDSINGMRKQASHLLDSLSPSKKLDRYTKQIDSTQQLLQNRLSSIQNKLSDQVDSLKSLQLPTDEMEAQIKSLRNTMDSLRNPKPIKDLQSAEAKLNELQTSYSKKVSQIEMKVNGKMEAVQGKLHSKLSELSNGQVAGLNVDRLKWTDAKLPQFTNGELPDLTNAKLPSLPGASVPRASIPGTNLSPSTIPKAPSTGLSIPNVQSPNLTIPGTVQLKDIQGKIGEVSKISEEAAKYSGEVKNISKGDLENTEKLQTLAESQVDTKEMRKLKEQAAAIEKYKEQAAKYRDTAAMKKELIAKAKDIAFDKLGSEQKKVDEAIFNLNKQKSKYGSIQSINDLPKRRYNPMRGKVFRERLLPGISLQVQSNDNLLVDVNPYIGYRFTERWIAGIGWNERIVSNFSKNQYFIEQDRIYGLRTYVQFKVGSKLTLRSEVEQMNTVIKPKTQQSLDEVNRDWVWSYFVGIKQDFKISKRLNGNAQVLYNLYDPKRESPYADRLSIRFGFEFPYKKPKRSENN